MLFFKILSKNFKNWNKNIKYLTSDLTIEICLLYNFNITPRIITARLQERIYLGSAHKLYMNNAKKAICYDEVM
jgi:hypothetical protein